MRNLLRAIFDGGTIGFVGDFGFVVLVVGWALIWREKFIQFTSSVRKHRWGQ